MVVDLTNYFSVRENFLFYIQCLTSSPANFTKEEFI